MQSHFVSPLHKWRAFEGGGGGEKSFAYITERNLQRRRFALESRSPCGAATFTLNALLAELYSKQAKIFSSSSDSRAQNRAHLYIAAGALKFAQNKLGAGLILYTTTKAEEEVCCFNFGRKGRQE